jgi:hypothetical protein
MQLTKVICVFLLTILTQNIMADISLDLRIQKVIGEKVFEIKKNILSEYNKEIIVQDPEIKEKIILTLKKFKNVMVNGKKIEPVQVNVRMDTPGTNFKGKTQTVTSFYNNEASFKLASTENNNLNLSLNFIER